MFWFLSGLVLGYVIARFFHEGLELLARAIWAKIKKSDDGGDPPAFV